MKGLVTSALLGVLLAMPVAAQIAASGQPTEAQKAAPPVRKAPPAPVSSPRATPALSGAPSGGKRTSSMLKVDVQAIRRPGGTAGIRLIRGGAVTMVHPGDHGMVMAGAGAPRRSQMKLIRVGASPLATYTRYGISLAEPQEESRARPPTIRINP
jgi:hypothetical protein